MLVKNTVIKGLVILALIGGAVWWLSPQIAAFFELKKEALSLWDHRISIIGGLMGILAALAAASIAIWRYLLALGPPAEKAS